MRLSKALQVRFKALEPSDGLGDCRYMLYFAEGWGLPAGGEPPYICVPVVSKKEAVEFLKKAERI